MTEVAGRPMKYPYTLIAKIAQFPYKHYYANHWVFRYWLFGIVASAPIFYKIQKMSCSPENVKKWDEIRRKNFTPHLEH